METLLKQFIEPGTLYLVSVSGTKYLDEKCQVLGSALIETIATRLSENNYRVRLELNSMTNDLLFEASQDTDYGVDRITLIAIAKTW